MKLNQLHIRTRIKQRLLNKYGLRFLKVKKQDFHGKIFQLVGMQIRLDNLRQECFQYAKPLFPKDSIFIDIDSHVIVNLPHDDRIGWGWHQESTYHPEIESCIGFWFPFLESSTRSNGTMSVLRGSNRLGRLPYTIHKPSNNSATTLVPDNMEQFQSHFPEVYCFLDPTDLLIFHMDLLSSHRKGNS